MNRALLRVESPFWSTNKILISQI